MASYRTIAASETDQDSPVTQTLMQALTDNPTAIAEGAAGAPKVETAALQVPTSGANVVGYFTVPGVEYTATTTAGNSIGMKMALGTGTITLAVDMKIDATNTGTVKFRKNGAIVNTQTTTSTSFVEKTHDMSVVFGDVIDIIYAVNATPATGTFRNFELRSGGNSIVAI